MFLQVLDYLATKPDPPEFRSGTGIGREGVAATAICIRWGTYFALLADRHLPLESETTPPKGSRISNEEMARINIEASAATAHWVEIFNSDHAGVATKYRIDRRRLTTAEEREVMNFAADRMALGMDVCLMLRIERERHQRSWSEQVLPCGLWLFAPPDWTLTEVSRDIRVSP